MKLILTYEEICNAISEYLNTYYTSAKLQISTVEIKVFSGNTELVKEQDFSLHAEVKIES